MIFFALLSQPAMANACPQQPDPTAALRTVTVSEIPNLVAEYRGCVVLLEVYASWCGTCTRTAPKVSALISQLQPEGLVPLAVSVDSSKGAFLAWQQVHSPEFAPIFVSDWTLDSLRTMFAGMGASFEDAIPLLVLFDAEGRAVLDLTEPRDLSALEERARELL